MGNGLFLREGAKVRYGEILAKIKLIYQQSDHSDCVKSLQWRFRQHKGTSCANCLVTKLELHACSNPSPLTKSMQLYFRNYMKSLNRLLS